MAGGSALAAMQQALQLRNLELERFAADLDINTVSQVAPRSEN